MKRCLEPDCSALTPRSRCPAHTRARDSLRLSGRALMEVRAAMRASLLQHPQPCPLCSRPVHAFAFDIDHIRPVRSFPIGTPPGVVNAPENLRPIHIACNRGARVRPTG